VTEDELKTMVAWVCGPRVDALCVSGWLTEGPFVAVTPERERFPVRITGDPKSGAWASYFTNTYRAGRLARQNASRGRLAKEAT
jgi:hypothetical protein